MADDTRYAYAVGRVRALEPRLIDRAVVDRLLQEDEAGLLHWARESPEYAAAFEGVQRPTDFLVGLERRLDGTLGLLQRIAPEPELIETFRLRYDYQNLRILFKARTLDRDPEPAFSRLGTIAPERLAEIVKDEAWLWLPEPLREAWREAEGAAARGATLPVLGALFDNALWRHRLAVVAAHGDEVLDQLYRGTITLHNIVTFIRVKDGAAAREDFDALLLDGGLLERSFFRRHYDEPVQLFLDSLGRTDFARHVLIRGVDALPAERQHWRLDLARDNWNLFFLSHRKTDCFSIAPLAHYYVQMRSEGKLLRTLWLAARAGWDRATTRERLRSIYA